MAGYIGTRIPVVSPGAERKRVFNVTGSQSVFTGVLYTPGFVHVFKNGERLVEGTDYTGSDGTSITLTSPATGGDVVVVISNATFNIADVVPSTGGTFQGSVDFADSASFLDIDIADKIAHAGDTDTSIRFPAADTVTVETAGSERVRVDASGNVGIGTTSPATALDVTGTITSDGLTVDGTGAEAANSQLLKVRNSTTGEAVTIGLYAKADNGGDGNSGSITFDAGANGSAANNELRFNADHQTSTSPAMSINGNGDISFYEDTGTTPKFFWDASAERLGIGTSSPATELDVAGNATVGTNTGGVLNVKGGSTTSPQVRFFDGGTGRARIGVPTGQTYLSLSGSDTLTADVVINSSGNVGIGTSSPSATLDVNGSLSKSSGSFKIDHPIKPDTHHLVHSFIEGPQADNIYRGKVALVSGAATVNLDEAGRMTEGTFVALNGNVQCFTTNEDGWTAVRGKVDGNILTIEAQDATCTDTVSWLVIGERQDQHMIDANWTDEQGRIITEPEKVTAS